MPTDQIKGGCFTRTVGANESHDIAFVDDELQVVDGDQPSKGFGEVVDFKQQFDRSPFVVCPAAGGPAARSVRPVDKAPLV